MKNKLNNRFLLFFLIFLSFLITLISSKLLNTEELSQSFYSEKFAKEQVEKILYSQSKWFWVSYTITPLFILTRTSLVTMCISIGLFFYDTENKTKFKQLFRVALLGEFVLVLVGFFKFTYFYFIKTNYTLEDLQQFYPLSYTNFLDLTKIAPWLVYPLQTINVFEIAYFFVLVYGVHKLLQNKYSKSFEMVAVSYGTGLVIWLGLVMFLTLNMT